MNIRITVDLPVRQAFTLAMLAGQHRMTMKDALKGSLASAAFLHQELAAGGRLVLVRDGRVTELSLPKS